MLQLVDVYIPVLLASPTPAACLGALPTWMLLTAQLAAELLQLLQPAAAHNAPHPCQIKRTRHANASP